MKNGHLAEETRFSRSGQSFMLKDESVRIKESQASQIASWERWFQSKWFGLSAAGYARRVWSGV